MALGHETVFNKQLDRKKDYAYHTQCQLRFARALWLAYLLRFDVMAVDIGEEFVRAGSSWGNREQDFKCSCINKNKGRSVLHDSYYAVGSARAVRAFVISGGTCGRIFLMKQEQDNSRTCDSLPSWAHPSGMYRWANVIPSGDLLRLSRRRRSGQRGLRVLLLLTHVEGSRA